MNPPAAETARTRNPWPIALVLYFAVFITFIVAFTVFAMRQHIDLVSHDYYEEEIHFQKQLDRLDRTQPLRAGVAVAYDSALQLVTITLPPDHARHQVSGTVRFYRPSDARLDQDVELGVNADGVQRVPVQALREGLWKVRVQWTLEGQEYFHDQPVVVIARPELKPVVL